VTGTRTGVSLASRASGTRERKHYVVIHPAGDRRESADRVSRVGHERSSLGIVGAGLTGIHGIVTHAIGFGIGVDSIATHGGPGRGRMVGPAFPGQRHQVGREG
jgi:hypothetical protein